MRDPSVRAIRQPPDAVPTVTAAPERSLDPDGSGEGVHAPVGEEQERDHTDGLLRVVGAVAECERGGGAPLAASDGSFDLTRRPPQRDARDAPAHQADDE